MFMWMPCLFIKTDKGRGDAARVREGYIQNMCMKL